MWSKMNSTHLKIKLKKNSYIWIWGAEKHIESTNSMHELKKLKS